MEEICLKKHTLTDSDQTACGNMTYHVTVEKQTRTMFFPLIVYSSFGDDQRKYGRDREIRAWKYTTTKEVVWTLFRSFGEGLRRQKARRR